MVNQVQNTKTATSVWEVLLKKWFIILIVFALCFGASVAYSFIKIKPVYTAQTSIVLKMAISDNVNASTNTNNATLAKKNLPTVKECLKSAKVAASANEYYNETTQAEGQNLDKASISVDYGEKSMIFILGYTDLSEEKAKAKLGAIIETAPLILAEEIEAESIDLVPVQNEYSVSVSDGKFSAMLIGGAIGLVLGVAVALLVHLLDNKVRSKEDLEEVSGLSVIAYIDREDGKAK